MQWHTPMTWERMTEFQTRTNLEESLLSANLPFTSKHAVFQIRINHQRPFSVVMCKALFLETDSTDDFVQCVIMILSMTKVTSVCQYACSLNHMWVDSSVYTGLSVECTGLTMECPGVLLTEI